LWRGENKTSNYESFLTSSSNLLGGRDIGVADGDAAATASLFLLPFFSEASAAGMMMVTKKDQ
jgi:hypothetical protein